MSIDLSPPPFDHGDDSHPQHPLLESDSSLHPGVPVFTAAGVEIGPTYEAAIAPEPDLPPQELDQLTDDMINLFDQAYDETLLNPLSYIHSAIQRLVNTSSAPEALKNSINPDTPITISHRPPLNATSGLVDAGAWIAPPATTEFPLHEIVTDNYRRTLADHLQVSILWPSDYPQDLIDSLESANLQASYQHDVEHRLNTPQTKKFLKLHLETRVQAILERYAQHPETPARYKLLASAYANGGAFVEIVEFWSQRSRVKIPQALHLRSNFIAVGDGLLIFLDAPEDDAVVPLPKLGRRWILESSPRLRRLVLERLPLLHQLIPGNHKLSYVTLHTLPLITVVAPLQFQRVGDVFEELHSLRLSRMLSDIDILVSTDSERLTDQLLETGVFILQGLSIVATLPIGGTGALAVRMLVSFLLGQGAAALMALRAANTDLPEDADAHYRAALYASIAEIVGPVALKLFGKALSAAGKTRVCEKLVKYLKHTRAYPGLGKLPSATVVPDHSLFENIKRDVTLHLSKGGEHIQDLIVRNARLIKKHVQGHDLVVYRGRVFRGDMRSPKEIFEKGFELRTPAAEIQKDIHQVTGVRGGFGGGHDALDLDGKGISTSAYYHKDHAGAFVYGGQKGGYTYLIDARRLEGYHLYQNHHNALYPNAKKPIKFRPLEINYASNIPATSILGAYDAAGTFIPNDQALRAYAREIAVRRIRAAAAAATAVAIKQPPAETE